MDCRLKPGKDDSQRHAGEGSLVSFARLRPLYDKAGARFVEVPVLHPADPFLETAGEDIRRRMFVTEGPLGERLALRPDFTIPVCLMHLEGGAGAARYAYEGLVFRRHDQGSPERLETGYEDFGGPDSPDARVTADAEALALAVECAATLAPGALSVRLGDIGLFDAVLRALKLPGRWRRRLRHSFGLPEVMAANLKRMTVPREAEDMRLEPDLRAVADHAPGLIALLSKRRAAHGHAEGAGRSPQEIAERFFDRRAIPDAVVATRAVRILADYLRLTAPLEEATAVLAAFASARSLELGDALSLFERRAAAIAALSPPSGAPAAPIRFDAGFGRPLDYYTGLIFEVLAEGLGAPLIGGGRYDRMMEMLGAPQPVPAVGFTLRLDLIEENDR